MTEESEKGKVVMKQALLRNTHQTDCACAAETREFVGGTVSRDAAFALLRWENEGGSPLVCPSEATSKVSARLRQSD